VSPGPVFRVLHVGLGTGLLVYNDVSKGGGLSPHIRNTLLAMWVHAKATPCGLCGLTFCKVFHRFCWALHLSVRGLFPRKTPEEIGHWQWQVQIH